MDCRLKVDNPCSGKEIILETETSKTEFTYNLNIAEIRCQTKINRNEVADFFLYRTVL